MTAYWPTLGKYVEGLEEAGKLGYVPGALPAGSPGQGDDGWCNLGQGQPETGDLPGAPLRVKHVEVALDDQDYAPIAGLWELRDAIAHLYNALYRRGMRSQYSAENVCVSGGGRFPRLRFDDFRLIHSVQRSHVRAGQDGSLRFGYPGASKS